MEDRVLFRREKEVVIRITVCSVFCYSAGLVDWTRSQLDSIPKMWFQAYKRVWDLPRSTDRSPIILEQADGDRGFSSATRLWIRAVLEVLEPCVSLSGEISQIMSLYLRMQFSVHGCKILNQLQLLIRLGGRAESVLELFLLLLDEQGLEISSQWAVSEDKSIVENIWPKLYYVWMEKESWFGCMELTQEVQRERYTAHLCLKACRKLGSAKPAILGVLQLRGPQTKWLHMDELKQKQCHLSLPSAPHPDC